MDTIIYKLLDACSPVLVAAPHLTLLSVSVNLLWLQDVRLHFLDWKKLNAISGVLHFYKFTQEELCSNICNCLL